METGILIGIWLFAGAIHAMFRLILKKAKKLEGGEEERAREKVKEGRKA